jgi:hypothetical protein
MKIAIFLSCTTILNSHRFKKSFGEQRINTYVNGLKSFFKYNDYFLTNNIDIFFMDNNIDTNEKLDNRINEILPNNVIKLLFKRNNYGHINCGAGLIEQWLECSKELEKYDYIIHFEPRQILKSLYFIETFLKNNTNIFLFISQHKQFYTGLFSIKTEHLISYVKNTNLEHMCTSGMCIENSLHDYFVKNKIQFEKIDKLDLSWNAVSDNINMMIEY